MCIIVDKYLDPVQRVQFQINQVRFGIELQISAGKLKEILSCR